MTISTRQQFKEYCLRDLGAPILEINVDDEQLEDRIDEALEYWRLYHPEGIEKVYLKQQINASSLKLVQPIAQNFQVQSVVTGQTSGAKARVTNQTDKTSQGTNLLVRGVLGTFVAGETIVSDGSPSVSATLDVNPVTLGEIDLKYMTLPDAVYGVTRLIPFAGTQTSKSMFDIQYQLRLNDLYDLTSTSIIYYKMVMSHLSLLDLELNGRPQMNFNRMQSRLYPIINWESDIAPGDFMIIDCYRALDPTTWPRIWSESWLKRYTIALFKKQWATNLKKFSGIQLPGGVTLDGQGLYQEAIAEIKDLEQDLMTKSAPLEFFLG